MSSEVDLGAIRADAGAVEAPEATPTIEDLADRIEQVDLLIADLGQLDEFNQKAREFTKSAATEITWNRWSRVAVLVVALCIIVGLSRFLWVLVTWEDFADLRENATAFSTVVVAVIGGGILLCHGVAKSVFTSFGDRNTGIPMPEHLKAVIDATSDLFGK
ncbi:hypothetical protein AAG596_14205 [Citromicrobium bathyomarinum]|uniref:hypothetical protein n=1 Tax=Citromicrobium bathyomarinum TaxID=72174 RepID=UPI00315A55D7